VKAGYDKKWNFLRAGWQLPDILEYYKPAYSWGRSLKRRSRFDFHSVVPLPEAKQ
jgi:hypothetical protein